MNIHLICRGGRAKILNLSLTKRKETTMKKAGVGTVKTAGEEMVVSHPGIQTRISKNCVILRVSGENEVRGVIEALGILADTHEALKGRGIRHDVFLRKTEHGRRIDTIKLSV